LSSGVYIMKDENGNILYVGKAVSLRKRVQSYFRKGRFLSKTDFLVSGIRDIECLPTASEAEALILEASLIKQHQPKFNVDLRDDKSYPYIEITNEEFPRVGVVRPRERKKGYQYYGPYVNAQLIREALTIIRKIFPFRTCEPFPSRECLDYHIGLCHAPCVALIDAKEYAKNIRNVRLILEGKKDELYRNLTEDMDALVREKNFESAGKVRDQIRAIGALYSGTKDVNYYKESEQLQRALGLSKRPDRIEAFDISNIMGNQAVGSMVSFFNGKPDKNNYRRFRIKTVEGIDDFKMIGEVVGRRYFRLKKENLPFPDLILIDGGKGQLAAAGAELERLDVDIPIISLAKQEEEIFLPKRRSPVILAKDSLGLQLLQRVRDEAHRFALSYHHVLRKKNVFGEKKRKQLKKRILSQ
jgi:excinuclease ABC subunit C